MDQDNNVQVQQPLDLASVQARVDEGDACNPADAGDIGVANPPLEVQQFVSRADRFQELNDGQENMRLHRALMDKFGTI
jgi:hypothetical protein